jgi:hypothetical protein
VVSGGPKKTERKLRTKIGFAGHVFHPVTVKRNLAWPDMP